MSPCTRSRSSSSMPSAELSTYSTPLKSTTHSRGSLDSSCWKSLINRKSKRPLMRRVTVSCWSMTWIIGSSEQLHAARAEGLLGDDVAMQADVELGEVGDVS